MTSKVEIRVDGKYKIGQLIAVGGNSEVYEGMNMHTLEPVALKLEYDRANPSLYRESEILKMLEGCIGIPLLYYVGKEGDFKIMVTELLGDDLRVILAKFDKPLGLKSCLMIADQIVCILQFIHDRGLVYNDMKPDNFCVGGEANYFHIHMIDFGLCQPYRDKSGVFLAENLNYQHILSKQEMLFSSATQGQRGTRFPKHDLESLMYMVLYMMTGSLPWEEIMQDESLDDFTKSSRVNQLKLEFHASAFWQTARVRLTFLDEEENSLHQIPEDLQELFKSIVQLDPKQMPDYIAIRTKLKKILVQKFL